MIFKSVRSKAVKKPKPEPKRLFKPKKKVNMKLILNIELESWGNVSASLKVKDGLLSIKSIELLQEPFIELNDGHSFLEYRNLSTKDIETLRVKCSKMIQCSVH